MAFLAKVDELGEICWRGGGGGVMSGVFLLLLLLHFLYQSFLFLFPFTFHIKNQLSPTSLLFAFFFLSFLLLSMFIPRIVSRAHITYLFKKASSGPENPRPQFSTPTNSPPNKYQTFKKQITPLLSFYSLQSKTRTWFEVSYSFSSPFGNPKHGR